MVCPINNKGSCNPISDLIPGRVFTGTINAFAPAANSNAKIPIKLIDSTATCPTAPNCNEVVLAESEPINIPIAATYDVAIDQFVVHQPRSKCKDSVKISLYSALQKGDQAILLCSLAGANYCIALADEGDHGTGDCLPGDPRRDDFVTVNNVRVGPFKLVPEVSESVLFNFVVLNLGETYSQTATRDFLNFLSQGAAGVLDATAKNNASFDTLQKWSEIIHGLAGCDGPVASGSVTLLNKALPAAPGAKTIDTLTAATGRFTDEFARIQGTDSAFGCGQNSRYSVKWSVIRTSWTAP
jgi:hypothetical protein